MFDWIPDTALRKNTQITIANFRSENGESSFEDNLQSYIHQELLKKKRRRAGLASAFSPGLMENNAIADKKTKEKLSDLYEKVLLDCGFKYGETHCYSRIPATWKISMTISTSYEIELILNDEKELIEINERSLNWVHDTLVSGKTQVFKDSFLTNPDMRILISSQEIVKEGSDLYDESLKYDIPVQIDEKNIPELLNENAPIGNVRHVESYKKYSNGNKIYGTIAIGKNYSFGLKIEKQFCDLSLYVDPTDLQNAIKNSLDDDCVDKFTKNVFYTSLNVKEKLEEILCQAESLVHEVIDLFCRF